MPTNKVNNNTEDRVDVYIPRGYANDDPNFFVSVNGVNYLLPKGKTSKVPLHIKEEIERSMKAQEIMDERINQMEDNSK